MKRTVTTRVPRVRTRGQMAKISDIRYTLTIASTGAVSYPFTGQIRDNSVDYRIMNDTVVTPFEKAKGEGQLFFNGMDSYELHIDGTAESGGCVRDISPPANAGNLHNLTGNWLSYLIRTGPLRKRLHQDGSILPVLSGITDSDMSRAVAESGTRASGLPSDAQLLVSIAEGMQTVKLLPDILSSFTTLLRNLNNGYSAWGRKALGKGDGAMAAANLATEADFLANLWLAYRFGVRPAVADAAGMFKAFQRVRNNELIRVTSRGNASVNVAGQSFGNLTYGVVSTPASESTSDSFNVRSMTLFAARLGMLDDLGVNLANVPLAVLDLTRFSFVLNWMVNVNEFALALGTAVQPGWDALGGCVVKRRETSTLYQTTGPSVIRPDYVPIIEKVRDYKGYIQTVERTVTRVPGAPKPQLSLRADPLRWIRDARLLDAITLFRQQVRGAGVRRLISFGV